MRVSLAYYSVALSTEGHNEHKDSGQGSGKLKISLMNERFEFKHANY